MDRISILIWNVRGLNDNGRDNLRKTVDASKPAVICLQETKLAHFTERDVVSFLGHDFTQFVFLPAQQTRGGILIACRTDPSQLIIITSTAIPCRFSSAARMILRGGSQMSMALNKMLIRFPF